MKFIFSDKANKGGVYKIINSTNGRIYIGSTSRFKQRAQSHKNDLEMNRHLNNFLQNDYNLCGSDCFIFEVVESVEGEKEKRLEREQFHIDQFYDTQKKCYNFRKTAADGRGGTRNVNPADRENDRRCQPHDETHTQKISVANKEAWKNETLREQSAATAKEWWDAQQHKEIQLTNIETNETITIKTSLRDWCETNNLSYKAMHHLTQGKIKSSQGWFLGTEKPVYVERKGEKRKPLSEEHRNKIARGKYTGIKLINEKGEILIVENNTKGQCRNLGLSYGTLLSVIKGKCNSVGGWRLLKTQ